jgi:glycosyltransferase involved in cell wall biosynthesis
LPGIELTVVTYGQPEARRAWPQEDFPDHLFDVVSCNHVGVSLAYERRIQVPLGLLRVLARLRPNVLVTALDMPALMAQVYAKRSGAGLVLWFEGTQLTEAFRGRTRVFLRRKMVKHFHAGVVPGRLSADYLADIGFDVRIEVAPNSVDEARFQVSVDEIVRKHNLPTVSLVFSGSLVKRKGVDILVNAYQEFLRRRPGWRDETTLHLVGMGPLGGHLGGAGVVEHGFLGGDEYADLLKQGQVFIMPSLHDCNPLAVVEALNSGNILVVSDHVGSYPEAVHGNGRVVTAGSVPELAAALDEIVGLPPDERATMGCRSAQLARDFSATRSAEAFSRALLHAASSHSR